MWRLAQPLTPPWDFASDLVTAVGIVGIVAATSEKIWENERWNFGRKRRFSGQFGGVLRGLDLVWESATPPTHIWERSPKKLFFWHLPLIHLVSICLAFRMFMSPLMLPTTSTTRMVFVILCCASWTTLATLPCYYHNMVDDAFRNENVVKATPSLEDTRTL